MVSQETALPRQALQWVEEGKPFDVALLDMQMPEMDGVTLAAEIQRCCQNKTNLPIVMLTSLGLREADQDRVTFAAYLTKPIKPAVLYATLLEVFGARPVALKHVKSEFEAPSQALKPLRILLAEDNMVNKKVALRLLERLGYKVDVAGNGLEVLEALQRQPYDVILMDVQMPEMDGLETTRQVRNGRWVETGKDATFVYQPYIIAMTASAMQGDREGCLAAGMDDYISKPIHLDELARVLGEARPSRLEEETSPSAPVAPPAPEKGNPVIDEETFRKFHQMVGDEDAGMMISLIKDYLDESPQLLAELHQAEVQKDREKTRRIAHSLGSSSMLFGALRLADLCRSVELGTRNGNLQHVPELILQVESEFKEVQIALETKYHRVQEK
jgi:CheY-like chemotaxis protein